MVIMFVVTYMLFLLVCPVPVGMESRAILDSQISASSEWASNHAAQQGRLHFVKTVYRTGAWSARSNDLNQWLQVDLLNTTRVSGVATQGRNGCPCDQWVTKYKLQYSEDGQAFKFYRRSGDISDTVGTNKTPCTKTLFLKIIIITIIIIGLVQIYLTLPLWTGRKTPSLALGICEFHQSYFYTHYTLLINRKLVSGEVRKLLFSVVKIEFNSRHYNVLHCLLWGSCAWTCWRLQQSIEIFRRSRNWTSTWKQPLKKV